MPLNERANSSELARTVGEQTIDHNQHIVLPGKMFIGHLFLLCTALLLLHSGSIPHCYSLAVISSNTAAAKELNYELILIATIMYYPHVIAVINHSSGVAPVIEIH